MRSRAIGLGWILLMLLITAASAAAEPAGIVGERFFQLRAGLFKPDEACWKLESERSTAGVALQIPVYPGADLVLGASRSGSGDYETDIWGGGFTVYSDPDARVSPYFQVEFFHHEESVPGPDPEGEQGFRFGTGLEIHRLRGFTLLAAISHSDVGTSDFLLTADLVRWFAGPFLADLSAGYGFDTETAAVSLGVGVGF